MAYRVCVERPRDTTPAGVSKLAEAIAARFGVAAETVAQRLRSGRFTARSQVDRATAERLASELERLGAVCAVVAEGKSPPAGPLGPAAPAPAPEPDGTVAQEYQSGLSAAFRADAAGEPVSLGALEGVGAETPSDSIRLATLDGEEEGASSEAPSVSFAPPPAQKPAAKSASASRPPPPKPEKTSAWVGTDPFAPPPSDEREIELAEDGRSPRLPPPSRSAPPTPLGAPAPAAAPPPNEPSHGEPRAGSPAPPNVSGPGRAGTSAMGAGAAGRFAAARDLAARARAFLAARPRGRFAAGLLLALLFGFLPAHFISAARERAAYAEVDGELRATYEQLVEPEKAQVEQLWQDALDEKRTARQNIAIAGCLLWFATGAAIAFLWFRKIDWDDS